MALGQKSILEMRQVSVTYGDTLALNDVNLDIPEHRVTVLIGPSGCGKSTTLRCLNGLVQPGNGTVFYLGRNIADIDGTNLRREMGYAIQQVGLMPHMKVWENVSLVPRLLGWDQEKRRDRSDELLQLVQLDPHIYADKYPAQLSGGESQRVGVARALGANPPVLLMDEPFGAVDPLNRETLQDEFIRIQRVLKKTVVFVTHDLEEAIRLADYLVIMKDGRVVQADSPEEILKHPADNFVEDFLGTDRAIKRLTLFTADQYMKHIDPRQLSGIDGAGDNADNNGDTRKDGDGPVWKVDENGRPVSVSHVIYGEQVSRTIDSQRHCVREFSSLKECMARVLALGVEAVPVVNENGVLIGEVLYEHIRRESLE